MKISTILAFIYLGTCVSGAYAAEFSAKGDISQTLEGSNNYFMIKSPSGNTGYSLSNIDLDFLAATPTTQYDLKGNFGYYSYFGPGAQDLSMSFGKTPGATFTIDHVEPLTKYNFLASWQQSDVATTSLAETGSFTGTGTTDTYNVGGGLKYDLSAINSLSWSAQYSTVSFSDPTSTPYNDYTSTAGWNRRLSATTTLVTTLNFDWLVVNNSADSQRLYWNPMGGLQSQLTKQLFVYGTVGWGFVNAYQMGSAVPTGTFQQNVGTANGWLGNFNLNYQIFHDTNASLTATRAISPTVFGQLLGVESVGFSLNHMINNYSNVSFFTQFSQTTTAATPGVSGSVSDFFTASASYAYTLAREWHSSVSYTYSQSNSQSGLIRASAISLTLTHDFTLFGKPPTGLQKTQSELAQQDLARAQRALPTVGFVPTFGQQF